MTNTQVINNLWQEMRQAINKTYAHATPGAGDGNVLRDYAEDISWEDAMSALLGRETANERDHRRTRPNPIGFSAGTAAKLIIMNCIVRGAQAKAMPKATDFLVYRQTAVEGEVIGWLIKDNLDADWIRAVGTFDYAKLMQEAS